METRFFRGLCRWGCRAANAYISKALAVGKGDCRVRCRWGIWGAILVSDRRYLRS